MTNWLVGAILGLGVAVGVIVAVRATPPMRPVRLTDRLSPYLGEAPAPSRLLAAPSSASEPFPALRALLGPYVSDVVQWLDRVVGGSDSVRRRLRGLGSETSVEEFRVEQVVWGVCGFFVGAVAVAGMTLLRGAADPVLVVAGGLVGGLAGVLGRDWWLSRQLSQREQAMLAEFPVIADLLALAVLAGEAPVDALQRICQLTSGELTADLGSVLNEARAGTPITRALGALADTTTLEPFGRFLQGVIVAIDRGTPLADVLRAQAADVREYSKRTLLEAGGRKELQMMMPVVFMILPVTVLFALYPGLLTLVSLTT